MKEEMMNENRNEKLKEENLEEISGGLNSMHLKVGGYADSPVVEHPVMNDRINASNVHPVINGKEKYTADHPVMKGMLGSPTLIDTNDAGKKDSDGHVGTLA